MRPVRVTWGKFRLEIPAELVVLLVLKWACLLFSSPNG